MAANIKVIDASALIPFLFADEKKPQHIKKIYQEFSQRNLKFIAPNFLKLEIGNAIKSATLQKRIDPKTAKYLFSKFLNLKIKYYQKINWQHVLKLSIQHNLSFYDAAYIFLAKSLKAPLFTLDNKLQKLA